MPYWPACRSTRSSVAPSSRTMFASTPSSSTSPLPACSTGVTGGCSLCPCSGRASVSRVALVTNYAPLGFPQGNPARCDVRSNAYDAPDRLMRWSLGVRSSQRKPCAIALLPPVASHTASVRSAHTLTLYRTEASGRPRPSGVRFIAPEWSCCSLQIRQVYHSLR